MGLLFFPRGGSAHVARNLAHALPRRGLGRDDLSRLGHAPGRPGDARAFYRGPRRPPGRHDRARSTRPTRCSPTRRCTPPTRTARARRTASSPRSTTTTPSTRSRPGRGRCRRPARADADVLHLHHLTPLNEAAARVAPGRAGRRPPARHRAADARGDRGGPATAGRTARPGPSGCARWAARLRAADRALRDARSSAPSGCSASTARALRRRSPTASTPSFARHVDRRALARTCRRAAGWRRRAAAVATRPTRGVRTRATPVLLYVGRFTEVKRVPLLIEAYARARPGFSRARAARARRRLPGRVGGRAPARRDRAAPAREDVFLAGWHDHDELPDFLAAADVVVLPSVREQFGQVLVEGDGLRAAGDRRRRLRPGRDRRPRRDRLAGRARRRRDALADALVEAVNRPAERRRRGANARRATRASATPGPRSPSGSRRSTTTLSTQHRCARTPR